MAASDRQVRKLFRVYEHSQNATASALAAGLCRQTASKYLRAGCLPSELAKPHSWRTRADPFAEVQTELVGMLQTVPKVPATLALARLQVLYAGRFADGQLRTLERRLREWRARLMVKAVFFAQAHVPGQWLQIDWTDGDRLGVTIGKTPFPHLLAHAVFPFSNWEWATVCRTENFRSLVALVRETVNRAGGLPAGLQTDNSGALTHQAADGRAVNESYEAFRKHYGLAVRTINLESPHEDGDVESAHRHFVRHLDVALGFRGSRDFDSEAEYRQFLSKLLYGRNAVRAKAWAVERRHLRPLPAGGLPEYLAQDRRVDSGSLVTLDGHVYSMPPSYIGERLRCWVGWERLEFIHGTAPVRATARVYGQDQGIEWRDLIAALAAKPGAFAGYCYRQAFFPSAQHRELYARLREATGSEQADRDYLGWLEATRDLPDERIQAVLAQALEPVQVPSVPATSAAADRSAAPLTVPPATGPP
jgi:hypothetical protein